MLIIFNLTSGLVLAEYDELEEREKSEKTIAQLYEPDKSPKVCVKPTN
jgi:hypothetical protein